MSQQHIRELLRELHSELQATDALDEQSHLLLVQVLQDVAKLLEQPGAGQPDPYQSVVSSLDRYVVEFETEHPRLSSVLSRITRALSDIGI